MTAYPSQSDESAEFISFSLSAVSWLVKDETAGSRQYYLARMANLPLLRRIIVDGLIMTKDGFFPFVALLHATYIFARGELRIGLVLSTAVSANQVCIGCVFSIQMDVNCGNEKARSPT